MSLWPTWSSLRLVCKQLWLAAALPEEWQALLASQASTLAALLSRLQTAAAIMRRRQVPAARLQALAAEDG